MDYVMIHEALTSCSAPTPSPALSGDSFAFIADDENYSLSDDVITSGEMADRHKRD